ncbi:MFS transporter [Rhizobium sp. L1K21]|uniref:MFS transporter n=1 Tax=Rhizobium sp. L1K21 TaxID=2954933 RepID=UPI0020928A37|nr:MFS transporter [Rhizobium sp. L1K21]MCO6186365.1 MFS transporter [Rhizobium sp. L1K21]
MRRNLLQILALLTGTFFLFLANGLHGLLLPVRGTAEGYSTTMLGLLGTSWASGFVLGCFLAPAVVKRVGHVRAFSSFVSLIAIVALITGMFVDQTAWVILRAATGFATAGVQMIIESWLNERADNESRGTVFSLYFGINLSGVVAGQLLISTGDVMTPFLFMASGVLYCIAMLPTTLSKAASPKPLNTVKLDLRALYRNSPVAVVGILLIGIANGAFGTLAAVFGGNIGLSQGHIAIMVSAAIFCGALLQIPAGKLSDMTDRRYVLAFIAMISAITALSLIAFQPTQFVYLVVLVALYGGMANTLYPIVVAHANDFANPEDYVKVSGGLLLVFGIGTIIGPTLGGPVMSTFGPYALFLITMTAHLFVAAYAILRSRARAAIPVDERGEYGTILSGNSPLSTPQGYEMGHNPEGVNEKPAAA